MQKSSGRKRIEKNVQIQSWQLCKWKLYRFNNLTQHLSHTCVTTIVRTEFFVLFYLSRLGCCSILLHVALLLPLQPLSNEREELPLRCLHLERIVVCNRAQIGDVSTHGNHRHRRVLIQRLNYSISMPGIEFTVCEINICQMSIEWTVHDVRSSNARLDGGEIESVDDMNKIRIGKEISDRVNTHDWS